MKNEILIGKKINQKNKSTGGVVFIVVMIAIFALSIYVVASSSNKNGINQPFSNLGKIVPHGKNK